MKKETLFLKVVVFLIGISVLGLCIWLPWAATIDPEWADLPVPVFIGVYAAAIPFFVALYQVLKLLSYIDQNKAFSNLSVKALKIIKYCAIPVSLACVAAMPFLYHLAQTLDAPGILMLGLIFAFFTIVIAVLAAVFQKLFKNAIDQKS